MIFAIIQDEKIVNVVVADKGWAELHDNEVVEVTEDGPFIDWMRINGKWVSPPPTLDHLYNEDKGEWVPSVEIKRERIVQEARQRLTEIDRESVRWIREAIIVIADKLSPDATRLRELENEAEAEREKIQSNDGE